MEVKLSCRDQTSFDKLNMAVSKSRVVCNCWPTQERVHFNWECNIKCTLVCTFMVKIVTTCSEGMKWTQQCNKPVMGTNWVGWVIIEKCRFVKCFWYNHRKDQFESIKLKKNVWIKGRQNQGQVTVGTQSYCAIAHCSADKEEKIIIYQNIQYIIIKQVPRA